MQIGQQQTNTFEIQSEHVLITANTFNLAIRDTIFSSAPNSSQWQGKDNTRMVEKISIQSAENFYHFALKPMICISVLCLNSCKYQV